MPNNALHTITLGEKHEEAPMGTRFASRAIITREDEILLMHEVVGDQWMLPGGGREEGESPEECCVREVKEETGFSVHLTDRFFTLDERYGAWRYVSDYFTCEIMSVGEPSFTEEEEELETESKWLTLDAALDIFSTWENYDPGTSRHGLYLREFTALKEYTAWKSC